MDYVPPQNADELLRRYRDGERYFAEAELNNADYDLRNAVLQGADFSRSYITADFREADLRQVKFINANIKTCDFRKADLRGAVFSGAALEGTMFEGANLQGAEFSGAFCYSYQLKEGESPW